MIRMDLVAEMDAVTIFDRIADSTDGKMDQATDIDIWSTRFS